MHHSAWAQRRAFSLSLFCIIRIFIKDLINFSNVKHEASVMRAFFGRSAAGSRNLVVVFCLCRCQCGDCRKANID